MQTIIIIKGTHCESCKILVEDVCKEFKEIISCEVDYKTGKTIIEHKENLDLKKLKKEIENLGEYRVEGVK